MNPQGSNRIQDRDHGDAHIGKNRHPHIGPAYRTQSKADKLDHQSQSDVLIDDGDALPGGCLNHTRSRSKIISERKQPARIYKLKLIL